MNASSAAASSSVFALAWRQIVRDFRAGELRLLVVIAVMLAVAAPRRGLFADRINGGLGAMRGSCWAAMPSSPATSPRRPSSRKAAAMGLKTAPRRPSDHGRATDEQGGATRLITAKAVAAGYLVARHAAQVEAPGGAEQELPTPGTVWVDAAVLSSLNLKVGDALLLGDASLRIAKVLVVEPDRGAGFRLRAARDAQPGRPAGHRAHPAGQPRDLPPRRRRARRQRRAGARLRAMGRGRDQGARSARPAYESVATGRPEMRQTLDRAESFNLVALLAACSPRWRWASPRAISP